MVCTGYCFCCRCFLRIPGMKSDDVCLIGALDVSMLSWFDFLLFTYHTHIHRDYWRKGKSLKTRLPLYCCWCAAAVYCFCFWLCGCAAPLARSNPPLFLIVSCAHGKTLSTNTYRVRIEAHTYTYIRAFVHEHRLWLSQRRALIARLLLYRDCHMYGAWRAVCDAVAQQQSEKKHNVWVSMSPARLAEK